MVVKIGHVWCPVVQISERSIFEVTCRPVVTYTYLSALRVFRLPLRANVPAQRTLPTNAFTAMRPFARLLWTLFNFPSPPAPKL